MIRGTGLGMSRGMTRVPFVVFVAMGTALAALIARMLATTVAPGRQGMVAGAALGTGVAGAFAAIAVGVFGRIRSGAAASAVAGDQVDVVARMARAFAGLMLARMLAYLALVIAAVVWRFADPAGVGAGLVAGTIVFQAMEVFYLRKLS